MCDPITICVWMQMLTGGSVDTVLSTRHFHTIRAPRPRPTDRGADDVSDCVKLAFHDADTDTDILARIVARMSACRSACHRNNFNRACQTSATILARK